MERNEEPWDNQNKFFSILGLSFVLFALASFLLLFFELLIFEPRPWVRSQDRYTRLVLYQSLLLVQYTAHCQFLDLSALGYLIWKYWEVYSGWD